jgi:hypothetical protein
VWSINNSTPQFNLRHGKKSFHFSPLLRTMSPVAPIEAPFQPRVIIEEASDEEYVGPPCQCCPRARLMI